MQFRYPVPGLPGSLGSRFWAAGCPAGTASKTGFSENRGHVATAPQSFPNPSPGSSVLSGPGEEAQQGRLPHLPRALPTCHLHCHTACPRDRLPQPLPSGRSHTRATLVGVLSCPAPALSSTRPALLLPLSSLPSRPLSPLLLPRSLSRPC